jgi:hypothetical protein
MALSHFTWVSRPLAANVNAQPFDVLKMKSVLSALGYYEAPEWGISQFPDPALFAALRQFQRAYGLKTDGKMNPGGETEKMLFTALTEDQTNAAVRTAALALQNMGRGGDEILAHITPDEALLLDAVTDGGSVNPATGLLEFKYGGGGGYRGHVNVAQPDDMENVYARVKVRPVYEYWSAVNKPSDLDVKRQSTTFAPGTAENPTPLKDERELLGKSISYAEDKVANRALKTILVAAFMRGSPPLMMTKNQRDFIFGHSKDPT